MIPLLSACAPLPTPADGGCTPSDTDIEFVVSYDGPCSDIRLHLDDADGRVQTLTAVGDDLCVFEANVRPGTYDVITEERSGDEHTQVTLSDLEDCEAAPLTHYEIDLCPAEPNPGLELVLRSPSGTAVCNADISAVDDTGVEIRDFSLVALPGGDCRYVGLFDQEGAFTIVIEPASPLLPASTDIIIDGGTCGPIRQVRIIDLEVQ